MSVSLIHLLTDPQAADTLGPRKFREIENYYHLEMIAENSEQLVDFQVASLAAQAEAAAATVSGFEATNTHLAEIQETFGQMSEALQQLQQTSSATLNAVNHGLAAATRALRQGFDAVAGQLLAQQQTLIEITNTLRRPYQTQMLELREQADKWIGSGMRNTGQARAEDFADATKLLHETIKNPIGNQDYAIWFQIGWLLWKHECKVTDAEAAFYRAARLSAPDRNHYYILSIRHLAHMQYLQGKHEDAYQTIHKTLPLNETDGTPFDAARYAAVTGRKREALDLLDQCIERQPTTIISMFADEDFRR